MKNLFLTLSLLFTMAVAYGQTTKTFNVYFDVDKHTLKTQSVSTLEEVVSLYKNNAVLSIGISAHTDIDASDEYNNRLSQRRARSVVEYLSSREINQSELEANWHGEGVPVAPNDTKEGKRLNRRVEIVLEYKPFTTADEILEKIKDKEQVFHIPDDSEFYITAQNGSEIAIPRDAFQDDLGRLIKNRNVQISVVEALSAKDGITNLLITETAEGEMLESGGMIKVTASLDGKPLKLREDKQLNVDLPSEDLKEDMSVFSGSRDADGLMRWNIAKEKFAAGKQDVKGAPLDLDVSVFQKFEKPVPLFKVGDFDNSELTFPAPPKMPKKPNKPREPKEVNPDKVVTGLKALFMTDAKKRQVAQEVYDQRYTDYEKRMARYHAHTENYEKAMLTYRKQYKVYEDEMDGLSLKIEQRREKLKDEFKKHKQAYDQARINFSMAYIKKRNEEKKFTSIRPEMYIYRVVQTKLDFARSGHLEYISQQLGYYSMLSRFDSEFIAKNFVKDNKISIAKMRKYYSKHRGNRYWDSGNSLQHNTIAVNMMNDPEVKEMIANAVSAKLKTDAENGISSQGAIDNFYSAGVKNLGWINCDRFPKLKMKVATTFAVAGVVGERVIVFLKKYRSLMSTSYFNGNRQVKIPPRQDAKVIHISAINGKPQLSIVEFQSKRDLKVVPNYKEVTLEELEKQLALL